MSGHRAERVGDRVRQVVADLLREEIRDPELGFVTVTGVDMSPDLRNARIHVSVMGDAETRERSLHALGRAAPFLRRSLALRGGLRFTPKLRFVLDETTETGFRIDRLLEKERPAEGDDGDPG